MNRIQLFSLLGIMFLSMAFIPADNSNRDSMIMKYLIQSLETRHFEAAEIDDTFSEQVHSEFLKRLDNGKRFFLKDDIAALEGYKTELDDEIFATTYNFFDESNNLLKERVELAAGFYNEILSKPFDFDIDEDLIDKRKEYAEDEDELREVWRKELKMQVLRKIDTYIENNNEKEVDEQESFEVLEERARSKVKETYDQRFKRSRQLDRDDRLGQYMNVITSIYDPHTSYLAPKEKKEFDIRMSGQLEGIGAQLSPTEGYLKIVKVIAGSPTAKQGIIKEDFIIMKVGQGNDEPVDIFDMPMDDAINLIRGKKGTEVRLTVKDLKGEILVVPIIRDVIEIKATFARSAIIEKEGKSYGYIYLPMFYANFNNTGKGRSCAEDVSREIEKIGQEDVDGIILDLRNNGGGSLTDVINMAGLFIESGPIVQVKSKSGSPIVYRDRDRSIQYSGPLAIMVNANSASASEIMAAAMQDYKRAIIIGAKTTYGKGTVQRVLTMPSDYGSVKLTVQKFYRINGSSTQLKGVEPDIVLPDELNYLKTGERQNKHSLEWDEVEPADYKEWNGISRQLSRLSRLSAQRVEENAAFGLIEEKAQWIKESRERNAFTLMLDEFKEEKEELEARNEKYKAIRSEIEGLSIMSLEADLVSLSQDPDELESRDKWHKDLRKDAQLNEALEILNDVK